MAKKFLVNLDLAKNQILNAAIQNLPSAPSSPVNGQIYYNTSDNRIYFWDSTAWVDMSGDLRSVIGGAGLTGSESNGIVTLDVNVDNSTIEIISDTLQVKDGGITTAKIANLSTDLSLNSQSNALATADAIKQYVDATVGSIGNLEGDWDVALYNTFPHVTSPAVIKKGDYWISTSVGIIYGTSETIKIEIGDVFVAKVDNANMSDNTQWIVLQANRDQATELALGLVRIADQLTVNAGTDDQEAVTPLKLKTYLDANVGGYAANIGDGINTSFIITHNLGTRDVIVSMYDNATYEEVVVDIAVSSTSEVTVSFATAPMYQAYRIVIKK